MGFVVIYNVYARIQYYLLKLYSICIHVATDGVSSRMQLEEQLKYDQARLIKGQFSVFMMQCFEIDLENVHGGFCGSLFLCYG